MKKFISLLLSAVVVFSAAATINISASADEQKTDFGYAILSNNTAAVSYYDGNSKSVSIPARIDGYTVTAIYSEAFAYNQDIENVVIPTSVTSIGSYAFYNCKGLKSVTIPESVTSIRENVFQYCESLANVTLPSGLSEIEDYLFDGCKMLSKVNIPDKVKSIGYASFRECELLHEISMPDTVRTLGKRAFKSCKSLASAKLSSEIKQIPQECFYDTVALEEINISKNVGEIEKEAFYNSGLKKLSVSRYLKKLGKAAVDSCKKLKSITVDKKNKVYSSAKGVLFNKKKTKLLTYPIAKAAKNYTVPKSVTTIKDYAFSYNQKLSALKLNKGLKTIEHDAFIESGIKTVTFPKTLKTIGYYAFNNCDNLKSVKLPTSLTKVGYNAFNGCDNLKSVDFKGSKSLVAENNLFSDCKSLKEVVYPVTKSGQYNMFYNCPKLSKVTISTNVKKIYSQDFAECPALKKITIPSSVKKIGKHALGYINYYSGDFDKNFDLVIRGKKNSAAHKYAKDNDFDFKATKK